MPFAFQGQPLEPQARPWEELHMLWGGTVYARGRRTDRQLPRRLSGSHCLPSSLSCAQGGPRTCRRLLHRPVALNQLDSMSLELPPLCGLPSSSTGPKVWDHLAILCQPPGSPTIPIELLL